MSELVVIAGSLAQRPRHGGHTWVLLQYLLGFKRLGWDVLFLDWLTPEMCVDEVGASCAFQDSLNLRYFLRVMENFGLQDAYALDYNQGEQYVGLPRKEVLEHTKRAAFLFNVMGFLTDPEILKAAPRRVFLDIDPGFGQMWRELELSDIFRGHDAFVTIGENIGKPGCDIPTCGLDWITTPQPVVLSCWPVQNGTHNGCFTSVASWRGPFGPIEYHGNTYGLRVHEFRKFASLPQVSKFSFQMALDIHPNEKKDLALLEANQWQLIEPLRVTADPWQYRRYIQHSMAEYMVAKGMYVQTHSGWFSDRSICYLASGRPVVAQDTGLNSRYPTGEGLLTFTTLEEAAACVDKVAHDYPRHARAARALAETFFDSDHVLTRLLTRLGITT